VAARLKERHRQQEGKVDRNRSDDGLAQLMGCGLSKARGGDQPFRADFAYSSVSAMEQPVRRGWRHLARGAGSG